MNVAPVTGGGECPAGGEAIVTAVGGGTPVTSYVCNGVDGQTPVITAEDPGANCAYGGQQIRVGSGAPS